MRTINYILEDVWSKSRVDVMEVFKYLEMAYFNKTADQNAEDQFDQYDWYTPTNMIEMEMMIETRPRYPSNKLTFTIADKAKGKIIRYFNINFNSNANFDVDVFLEDSKRNFVNSLRFFFVF